MKNTGAKQDPELLPDYDFSKSRPGRHKGRVSRDAKIIYEKEDGSPASRPATSARAGFKAAKHK